MRVLRAFFKALWLTLQGKTIEPKPPVQRYPLLEAWRIEGVERVRVAMAAAEKSGFDEAGRKAFTLVLESRKISMETILKASEHNLTLEYPMLMAAQVEHNLTTLYALNLNDRYRVGELANALTQEPARMAVQRLSDHLHAIPSSTEVQQSANS